MSNYIGIEYRVQDLMKNVDQAGNQPGNHKLNPEEWIELLQGVISECNARIQAARLRQVPRS